MTGGLMAGAAVLSRDSRYRYRLDRVWDEQIDGKPGYVCWVMLNPSTADARQDDPTIRRCIGFTKSWGYSSLTVVNLFGLRATDPKVLCTVEDPTGPDNDRHLVEAAYGAALVVCAWGQSYPPHLREQVEETRAGIMLSAARVTHLGLTSHGGPRHPLYVKGDTALVDW